MNATHIYENDAGKMNSQITIKYMLDYCSKELTIRITKQGQATTKRLHEEDEGRSKLHKLGKCGGYARTRGRQRRDENRDV
jgi:hypothetical protein